MVLRLIQQFFTLKLFFTDAVTDGNKVAAKSASEILEIMNDESTLLYLLFLKFVMPVFNQLNKLIQSEYPQIHKLKINIERTCRTFMDSYMRSEYLKGQFCNIQFKNPRHFKPTEDLYLGADVVNRIEEQKINPTIIQAFRLKCLDFFIQAVTSIVQRFDFRSPVFNNHSSAASERIFSKVSLFKTKTRNNMRQETICGLLHTDALVGDYACHDFPIEKRLLNMMTKLVYK